MGARSWLTQYIQKGVWEKIQVIGFLLLILIIVFEAIFFTSIWYGSLQSGLTIYIDPEQELVHTIPGEPYTLGFSYGVTNAPFCQETCQYTLIDQRTNEHSTGMIIDPQAQREQILFELQSPIRGAYSTSQQLIITCTNQETPRCQRPQDVATQTALVRVNHERLPAQEEAYALLKSSLNTEILSNTIAETIGVITVEDVRASTIRQQAIQELQLLQNHARALKTAIESEEFILATRLLHIPEVEATNQYRTLRQAEQQSVSTYQHLLEKDSQQRLALPFISEQDYREQITAYTRAITVQNNFYQTHPSYALEQFVRANHTPQRNLTLAREVSIARINEQEALCQQNVTICPQPYSEPATLQETYNIVIEACEYISQLPLEYQTINQTYIPTNQTILATQVCARTNRVLPILLPAREATLPESASAPVELEIFLPQKQCCANGLCVVCSSHTQIPVIFVHGHSFAEKTAPEYSVQAFSTMALALQQEGRLHAGAVFPRQNVIRGLFADTPGGISVVTTYYYDGFAEEGEVTFVVRKTERIETYALRLRETIRNVKELTGQDQVFIVAHSMGGLVTRSYLEIFGEEDIAGVVMIGTPNNGIPKLIERLCPVIGADFECSDMRQDSLYLRRLSQAPHPTIPVLTIAGTGCDGAFDGVVEVESVALPYATNKILNGTCPTQDILLHNRMLYPDEYPEVFELVIEFLSAHNR